MFFVYESTGTCICIYSTCTNTDDEQLQTLKFRHYEGFSKYAPEMQYTLNSVEVDSRLMCIVDIPYVELLLRRTNNELRRCEDSLNFFSFSKYPVYRVFTCGFNPPNDGVGKSVSVPPGLTFRYLTRERGKKVPCGNPRRLWIRYQDAQIFVRVKTLKDVYYSYLFNRF